MKSLRPGINHTDSHLPLLPSSHLIRDMEANPLARRGQTHLQSLIPSRKDTVCLHKTTRGLSLVIGSIAPPTPSSSNYARSPITQPLSSAPTLPRMHNASSNLAVGTVASPPRRCAAPTVGGGRWLAPQTQRIVAGTPAWAMAECSVT